MEVLSLTESGSIQALNLRAQSLGNLTAIHTAQGDLDSALKSNKGSIEIHTRIHGANHIETLRMQQNLAIVFKRNAQYAEAESIFRILEQTLVHLIGKTHLLLADIYEAYASTCLSDNKFEESERLHEEVIRIRTELLKEDDRLLVLAHLSKAFLCTHTLRFSEAEKLYRENLPRIIGILGESHSIVLKYRERFSETLNFLGKIQEAKEVLSAT
jgi:tetratricopeptide (TPR) repeat protein